MCILPGLYYIISCVLSIFSLKSTLGTSIMYQYSISQINEFLYIFALHIVSHIMLFYYYSNWNQLSGSLCHAIWKSLSTVLQGHGLMQAWYQVWSCYQFPCLLHSPPLHARTIISSSCISSVSCTIALLLFLAWIIYNLFMMHNSFTHITPLLLVA